MRISERQLGNCSAVIYYYILIDFNFNFDVNEIMSLFKRI